MKYTLFPKCYSHSIFLFLKCNIVSNRVVQCVSPELCCDFTRCDLGMCVCVYKHSCPCTIGKLQPITTRPYPNVIDPTLAYNFRSCFILATPTALNNFNIITVFCEYKPYLNY